MPDDVSRRSFLKQSAAGAAAGGFVIIKPELVRGTHGRVLTGQHGPLLISGNKRGETERLHQTQVKDFLLAQLLS